jgi:hypothetical protein
MSRRSEGVRCCRRRDAVHGCCLSTRHQPGAVDRPEAEGSPGDTGPPSRATHHGGGLSRDVTTKVGPDGAAVGTAEPQVDQRHVTAAGIADAGGAPATRGRRRAVARTGASGDCQGPDVGLPSDTDHAASALRRAARLVQRRLPASSGGRPAEAHPTSLFPIFDARDHAGDFGN